MKKKLLKSFLKMKIFVTINSLENQSNDEGLFLEPTNIENTAILSKIYSKITSDIYKSHYQNSQERVGE